MGAVVGGDSGGKLGLGYIWSSIFLHCQIKCINSFKLCVVPTHTHTCTMHTLKTVQSACMQLT